MSVTDENIKQIEGQFKAEILKVLEAHGVSYDWYGGHEPRPRIVVEIEIDHALRMREFAIIVPLTSKEIREWNT